MALPVIHGEVFAEHAVQGVRVASEGGAVGDVEPREVVQTGEPTDVTLQTGAVQEQDLQATRGGKHVKMHI